MLIRRHRASRTLAGLYTLQLILSAVCVGGNLAHIRSNLSQNDVLGVAGAVLLLGASISAAVAMVALVNARKRIVYGRELYTERTLLIVVILFYAASGIFVVSQSSNPCALTGRVADGATTAPHSSLCAFHYLSLIAGLLAWLCLTLLVAFNVYRARRYGQPDSAAVSFVTDDGAVDTKHYRYDSFNQPDSLSSIPSFTSCPPVAASQPPPPTPFPAQVRYLSHHRHSANAACLGNTLYHTKPMP
ncbi:hypothetical protein IWQ60_011354 [Tieghemiomyces parasiticus]|uniref:MARVEL domain-containing protein n=1 Tax=Tieghemiomyces parasiticus TaxID=78921 RepID=A0A9W8DHD3_9FUNG|nr:hypothetical protein IWQ60_011354 [Tieghemiomyces parasiticus]